MVVGNTDTYEIVYAIDGVAQTSVISESRCVLAVTESGTYTLVSVT